MDVKYLIISTQLYIISIICCLDLRKLEVACTTIIQYNSYNIVANLFTANNSINVYYKSVKSMSSSVVIYD